MLTPEPAFAREKRNTEPVALSSAVPTGLASWALRPSALGLWGRHRLTRAPYSVRAATYETAASNARTRGRTCSQRAEKLVARTRYARSSRTVSHHVPEQVRLRRKPDRSASGRGEAAVPLEQLASIIGNRAFKDGVVAPHPLGAGARAGLPGPRSIDLLIREIARTELGGRWTPESRGRGAEGAVLQRTPDAEAVEGHAEGAAGPGPEQGARPGRAKRKATRSARRPCTARDSIRSV